MRILFVTGALVGSLLFPSVLCAEGWVTSRDEVTNQTTQTLTLRISPAAEPRPALSVRFIPDESERADGNSMVHYLKAMGFFEQNATRQKITEYSIAESERINNGEIEADQRRPYVWLTMRPDQIPLEEAKEYLQWLSWQPKWIREAVKFRGFSGERNMASVDFPIGYLLPEIQSFREFARMQSLRCRVAIAEDRVDDAIEIVGQQYAMANHLSKDDFFVSALVGAAIHAMACDDALYIAEHPDAPNMFWAYAMLPNPVVDMPQAYAWERGLLYQQLKPLKEVTENPRPAGYWSDVIRRLTPGLASLEIEGLNFVGRASSDAQQLAVVTALGSGYSQATTYLVEEAGMDRSQVEAYPTMQTVLLAACKLYEELRDEQFKLRRLPYPEVAKRGLFRKFDKQVDDYKQRYGVAAELATVLFVGFEAIWNAEQRCEMREAMGQAVEAIRLHMHENDGTFPRSLDGLSLPPGSNPHTGADLGYENLGGRAVITGEARFITYRIILEKSR